jgi:peptidoglycan/LPS O-acetylase OafA/YrhL
MSDKHRIKPIDGLRAIAVICVLAYHLFPAVLPGGFVGVDMFFVISGYVVCGSLLKTASKTFWDFATGFYARRVLRIYPALIVLLTAIGVLSRLFIPDSSLAGSSRNTGFAAFFGLSNFQLVWRSDGYFGPTGDFNPYHHTWSLAVEEQFYFLFPLILFLCLRSRQIRSSIAGRLASWLLPFLFCSSLVFSGWETVFRHDAAYYLLPSRFWELALGAILCLEHAKARLIPSSSYRSGILILCGFIGIGVSTFLTDVARFPFPWAIAPALGTACCISGLVGPFQAGLPARILSSPFVTYLGRISYSLYLWHWPVIVLLRWTIGLESLLSFAVAILITCVFACLSYHLIERPIQSLRSIQDQWTQFVISDDRRAPGNGKVLLALPTNLAVILCGIGVTVLLSNAHLFVSRSMTLPLSVTMRSGGAPNPWKPYGRSISNQKLVAGERGRAWSGRRLFVLGDSHASAYIEMLSELQRREGVSIYLYWSGGLRLGSLLHPQRPTDRTAEQSALEALQRHAQPGDIVLLSSLRVLRLGSQWRSFNLQEVIAERDSEQAEMDRRIAVREGKELVRKLEEMGLTVIIEAPKPVFTSPPFRCSDWFNRMNPIGRPGFVMERDFFEEHRSAAMRSIAEVRQEHPSVRVWDPFLTLCTGATCAAFDGDKPLFFDNDHLSSYGNQKLYPAFVDQIDAVWGGTATIARRE